MTMCGKICIVTWQAHSTASIVDPSSLTQSKITHSLFLLSRTITIADVVKNIKTSSSVWMKEQGSQYTDFNWQGGYGDFGVSASDVDDVRAYIANQRERHRKLSFQDEYRAFLHRHNIEYDERYVWD